MNYSDNAKGVSLCHWLLFAVLQFFNLYQLVRHSMWRDELQVWSMVRESKTVFELIHNMRYDGFPPLWYFSLWVLSFISTSPLTMQLFHYICSFAAQLLVMSRAPFSGNMRLAMVAGYFISFEYCIISRAYVMGVFLLFLFCATKSWLEKHPIMKGCILGLLANTSVSGAILSVALAVDHIWWVARSKTVWAKEGEVWRFTAAYGLLLILAIVFMMPPPDGIFALGWEPKFGPLDAVLLFLRNLLFMVPVPSLKSTFWNSVAVIDAGLLVCVPVSLGVMLAIWYALRRAPRYLGLFAIGFAGIWLFTVLKYHGFLRHVGSAMIFLIACFWLMVAENDAKQSVTPRSSQIAIWCIIFPNIIAWGIASYYHLTVDFSGSREMARIIEHSKEKSYPIIADIDYATSSVAGYLNRPLYYVNNNKFQTFIRWNTEREEFNNSSPGKALALTSEFGAGNNGEVLLLTNYPVESATVRLIDKSGKAIVADEVFYLYEYVR